MIKNNDRKIMLSMIGIAILVIGLVGVTYSFFNYTRTGANNVIRTGLINFDFDQDDTITLTNVFPISSDEVATDTDNSDEVIVAISGNTTYSGGVEYLITTEDVNITIGEGNNYKKIPVSLIITPEKTGDLGTTTDDYWNNRGGDTSYYSNLLYAHYIDDYYMRTVNQLSYRDYNKKYS